MDRMGLIRDFVADLLHLPVILKLALVWAVGATGWSWWKQRQKAAMIAASVAWPLYRARVIAAQVVKRQRSRGDRSSWEGVLTYSFTVPGKELEIGEFRKVFYDEGDAELWASGLQDRHIDVRVNPDDANQSVWEQASYVAAPLASLTVSGFDSPSCDRHGIRVFAIFLVFCLSAAGALLAAAIQCSCLMGKPMTTATTNIKLFFGMHLGAMSCALGTALLLRRSVSGRSRSQGWQAYRAGPLMVILMKAAGMYYTLVFLIGFVGMSAHPRESGYWAELMFSAAWLTLYLGSAFSCGRAILASEA